MKKLTRRSLCAMSVCTLFLILLAARTADITAAGTASVRSDARSLQIAAGRGVIYDRNLTRLTYGDFDTALFVNPTAQALAELESLELTAPSDSSPFVLLTRGKTSVSSQDILPFAVFDRYSPDTAHHIIGYSDDSGRGVYGIERAFDTLLTSLGGSLSVSYGADAHGAMLRGEGVKTSDSGYIGGAGLVLTVDANIQKACERALEAYDVERGAAVVLSVQTGEILALASVPVFDRDSLSASIEDLGEPFRFRCLEAFPVGSVFKSVVAAAALEGSWQVDGITECTGSISVGSVVFNCHKRDGHSSLTLEEALCESCNPYFIALGEEVGAQKIIITASLLGFGKELKLYEGAVSHGNLPSEEDIDSLPALANLSFGQGELLATPLEIAAAYAAIANGGIYNEPYILKETVDDSLEQTAYYKSEDSHRALSEATAQRLCDMLEYTVANSSARLANGKDFASAGKTGTAQNSLGGVHTWFAGFFPADEPRYAAVVFKEDGDVSSSDCCPVFRMLAEETLACEQK